MSTSFYLGPYVICKREYAMQKCAVLTCPDRDCKRHGSSMETMKFCPTCGKELSSIEVEQSKPIVNRYEIMEDLHERLCDWGTPEYNDVKEDRYVPNYDGDDLTVGHFGNGDSWLRADIVGNEETSWFYREFREEIDALRKAYGPQNVKVMWGLLAHWS